MTLTLRYLIGVLVLFTAVLVPAAAQEIREQDVIDMVTTRSPFTYGLETVPGWRAAAYNTKNAYGIWRVQFWNADDEEIAWANIDPVHNRMYDYEAHFESTDAQRDKAAPLVRAFVYKHPDVIALLGDPEAYADKMWVGYNGWANAWGVWVERGDDSLYLIVQFEGKTPDSLTNPTLVEIGFPNVMTYDEWETSMQSDATVIAFAQADVAAALRDVSGWESHAERQDDGLWAVTFTKDGDEIVSALVDLEARQVVKR